MTSKISKSTFLTKRTFKQTNKQTKKDSKSRGNFLNNGHAPTHTSTVYRPHTHRGAVADEMACVMTHWWESAVAC